MNTDASRLPNLGLQIGSEPGARFGAAVAAAKRWVLEPAKIGGHNVAAKHAIAFRFAPR